MYIPNPYFKGIPRMGDLVLDYIFIENGYPVLFTCKKDKMIFLCLCRTVVNEQKWIVSEIDIDILKQLINNEIPICAAFKKFNGFSCIVRWNYETKLEDYRTINSCDILDQDLPDEDVYLDDDGDSIGYLEMVKNRFIKYKEEELYRSFREENDTHTHLAYISIDTSLKRMKSNYDKIDSQICFNDVHFSFDYNVTLLDEDIRMFDSAAPLIQDSQKLNLTAA